MDKDGLAHNREDSLVLHYINVTASAIGRVRIVIIVMIVACVFVFTQVRNSDGWLDRRITVRIYALRLLDKDFDDQKEVLSKSEDKRASEAELYKRARNFIEVQRYTIGDQDEKDRLQNQIKDLIRIRDEQMRVVRLPFFGAAFDANDTAIYAGITFSVVLFWLTLTMNRERLNTQVTFRIAESRGSLRLCYNLLAMQQVLTLPPTRANRYWKILGYVFKLLYVTPLAIYGLLFHHELDTRATGNSLGWDKLVTLLWACGAFFILILILTIICFTTSLKIDKDWAKYTEKVKSLT